MITRLDVLFHLSTALETAATLLFSPCQNPERLNSALRHAVGMAKNANLLFGVDAEQAHNDIDALDNALAIPTDPAIAAPLRAVSAHITRLRAGVRAVVEIDGARRIEAADGLVAYNISRLLA